MAKNSRSTYGVGNSAPITKLDPLPVKSKRNPTISDKSFEIGTRWINTLTNNVWSLTSVSNNISNWEALSSSAGGNAPITEYVVAADGSADYTTIQSAMDAANSAGGNATVYIKPGTYVENLTLYDSVHLIGSDEQSSFITGIHIPPPSGTFNARRLTFNSTGDTFLSAVVGTTTIITEECTFNVTSGHTFDLLNWTGYIGIFNCTSSGTADGGIRNNGGATVFISNSIIGVGNVFALTVTGVATIIHSDINCPVSFNGSSVTNAFGSQFLGFSSLTTNNSATVFISNSLISTGSATPFAHSSSNPLTVSNTTINASSTDIIIGVGTGAVSFGGVSLLDSNTVQSSITQSNVTQIIGGGIILIEGTNAKSGLATLVAGTITVATTQVTANSRVQLTHQDNSGTPGWVSVTARVVGTSFTITSSNALDTSNIAWLIVEPS